jgi:hypothetical protein
LSLFANYSVSMKLFEQVGVGLFLLSSGLLWAQDNTPSMPVPAPQVPALTGLAANPDPMLIPPPVSGQVFPTLFTSEERSNYLRGGLAFTSAYTNNALGSVNGEPVSDIAYSVFPTVALDETTPRMHTLVNYAPGFTFYQHTSSRNEQDQNASIDFAYRLSPHVTFSARDLFQKSSNVFNQPDLASAEGVSGGAAVANFSVIPPIADRLSNSGNVGIVAQIAANAMVGASGIFTNLHYPNEAEVPGLFDTSSQAGEVFYSLRVSPMHYLGVTYQYQRLLSYPTGGENETQTQAVLFFYTLYPNSRFSISFFGGPQYANAGPQLSGSTAVLSAASRSWNPAAGASLSWQRRVTTLAMSYSHIISNGGGLPGAVRLDNASLSIRQQLTRTLRASLTGGYAQNDLLTSAVPNDNGHTLSATPILEQQFRQHVTVQLGYTRLHQDYSNVPVISQTPDTNREFISVSYEFSRPLGR